MAYPHAFIKLSISGTTADTDIWSNGLSLVGANTGDAVDCFANLEPEDLAAITTTFYRTTGNSMNSFNTLNTIKLALIGTDGKYLEDPKIYDYPTASPGAGNFNVSPQDTVVLSLVTPNKRGLAKRGRIYLPAGFAQPTPTTGRLSTVSQDTVLAKAKTWIDAMTVIIQAANSSVNVCVASNVREGDFNEVLSLEVGDIMDNQSRRRNRLQEVYNTIDLF